MRAKDKCPSCHRPIARDDFMCANCELILSPALATTRPVGEISVVRRLLEIPQRGVPTSRPSTPTRAPLALGTQGLEGPTRVMSLPPEVSGVPVVVATLAQRPAQLSELEAWVVSLIDGLHDAPALAKKIGLKELELRVMLTVLQSKGVVDFADEPLSDADLEVPAVMGTLDEESEEVPLVTGEFEMQPPPPPGDALLGDEVAATDQHFVPPVVRAGLVAKTAPAYPGDPVRVSSPARGSASVDQPRVSSPARGSASVGQVAPPYPGAARERSAPLPNPLPASQGEGGTDPRIQHSGNVNRRVLDALKKVKRVDPAEASAPSKEQQQQTFADVMARDSLQVALRMEQSGRLDEAIRFLEKSISQSPDAPSLYNRLGIVLMRERSDYRRAEVLIRKAIELAPENTVYATNLQQVLSRQALREQH